MCGLAGFFDRSRSTDADRMAQIAARMSRAIEHRGPDDNGVWVNPEAGIAFGFRRLAIVDLTEAGHQPMASPCGRYRLIYNGEIYNHPALRVELQQRGHAFRGRSDTEVLLAAITEWGLAAALQKTVGMFALALWDQENRELSLARDRLGIKPLYYAEAGPQILFASELKALRQHPQFSSTINRDALVLLLRHNYVPAPYCIYQNAGKLIPGTIRTFGADPAAGAAETAYWDMKQVAERGRAIPFAGTDQEAIDTLDALLRDAVRLRMQADVPLGAFLSGGIDSSLVVALMQQQSTDRIRTFTIGFEEQAYDEAPLARAVANHLGTEHVEHYVTPRQAQDVIPRLPQLYDEPFADSSQIPTYLVSELTRRHVTVALAGDGGDEFFAGYNHYEYMLGIWHRLERYPAPIRRAASTILRPLSAANVPGLLGRKLASASDMFSWQTARAMYAQLQSHWKRPLDLVIGAGPTELPTRMSRTGEWPAREHFREEMMYIDSITYLPDDILVKVDRASMAVSLEVRVPLIDHRLVELAWSLPLAMKHRQGTTKWALRQLLARYVPTHLFERPKTGFGIPLGPWLRGPLRAWCEELIGESRLRGEGFFHPDPIRRKWAEHLSGRCDWHYHLWDVLMFQAWLEREV